MGACIPSIRSQCTQLYGCLPVLIFAVTLPNERVRLSSQVYKTTVNCASLFRRTKELHLHPPQIAFFFFLLVCFLRSPLADANSIMVSFKIMIICRQFYICEGLMRPGPGVFPSVLG